MNIIPNDKIGDVEFKMERPRLYYYICLGCHNNRVTKIKKNLRRGICRLCRANQVPEGQEALFN